MQAEKYIALIEEIIEARRFDYRSWTGGLDFPVRYIAPPYSYKGKAYGVGFNIIDDKVIMPEYRDAWEHNWLFRVYQCSDKNWWADVIARTSTQINDPAFRIYDWSTTRFGEDTWVVIKQSWCISEEDIYNALIKLLTPLEFIKVKQKLSL